MTLAALLRHLAFAVGLALLSAAVVRAMIAVRVLDRPDPRKVHTQATPKGGGVGVVVAFLVGIAVLYRFAEFARLADPYFVGVIEASVAIAVVAFLDDMYDWKFTVKLAAQIMAARGRGRQRHLRDGLPHPLCRAAVIGWLAPPVTVLWLLFATNAMNFIDGLNGLAGGVALIAAGFLAAIAAANGGWFAYFAALLLAAGLAGFLPFNFPRARIFMGDVGSQFCGFILGSPGRGGQPVRQRRAVLPDRADAAVGRAVRRSLHPDPPGTCGRALTEPHRGHLYQVAQRSGLPAVAITLVHWGFAGVRRALRAVVSGRTHAGEAVRPAADAAAATVLARLRGASRPAGRHRALGMTRLLGRGPTSRASGQAFTVRRRRGLAHRGLRRLLCGGRRLAHDRAQVAQEGSALQRPLHQDAAAIQRVHLAPCQIDLAQPIERARDRRLRNLELGRQAAHRMSAVAQVAGQEDAKLAGRQIGAIAPHQGDDGLTEDADHMIGRRTDSHGSSFQGPGQV